MIKAIKNISVFEKNLLKLSLLLIIIKVDKKISNELIIFHYY